VPCALCPAVIKNRPGKIADGHPSGVDLVLLSFTPGKTGATGWPALQAGYLIAISLLDSTGFTERPALKVGCLIAISLLVIPALLENQGLYLDC